MAAKFKVGNKVRFVTGTPKKRPAMDILLEHRRRSRAIINAFYDPNLQCTFYELYGIPGFFRSYSLKLVTKEEAHTRGTPRLKRSYIKRKVRRKV